jgi:hypothetical protein
MAADDYTPDRLMAFLRDAAMQGRINPAVAKSRQSAIEQLFVELDERERADIRRIDVDRLCQRLHKLQDSSIRPEVVMVYNKRVQAALADYFAWLDNPQAFSSIGGDGFRKEKRHAASDKEIAREQKALEEITLSASEWPADLIAVPLREDRTVYVQNLPLDLTAREARKIARVIQAMAQDADAPGADEDAASE